MQRGHLERARRFLAAIVLGACLSAHAIASAQEPEPQGYRELVREGLQEFDRGNWSEAYAAFKRAHAVFPNARTQRSLGVSAFEARRYVTALDHLRAALEDGRRPLTPEQRAEVESFIARADGYVARLSLTVTPLEATVAVDGGAAVPVSAETELLLDPGIHDLVFTAPGSESERIRLEVVAGEQRPLHVTLRDPAVTAGTPARGSASVEPTMRVEADRPPARLGPYLVLGAGGALLIGAAVTGLLAQSAADELEDNCDQNGCDPSLETTRDRGEALETATNVLLGVGAAAVVAGGVWWLLQSASAPDERASAAFGCGPTGCAVSYRGRF
jgi:hypothetical protein